MIAVDTNVLVFADREELPLHGKALDALRRLAEGQAAWALPVFCLTEFVRVVSHPRLFDPPTPTEDALESIGNLLGSPSARLLSPRRRFWPIFRRLVHESSVTGNMVFDAQIAAVCLEHGARTILTEDRDFLRFSEISVQPL